MANGYLVMMPNRASEVGYVDRIDTAYDWWSTKTNDRFVYVPIDSNAHGGGCAHDGSSWHGGSQLLAQSSYDGGLDYNTFNGYGRVYNQIARDTPPTVHERFVQDRCTNTAYPSTVYEICTQKAREMRTAYVETDFHSTHGGADYIYDHDGEAPRSGAISLNILYGINCYYVGGFSCDF